MANAMLKSIFFMIYPFLFEFPMANKPPRRVYFASAEEA
jgi:hypothetical protein